MGARLSSWMRLGHAMFAGRITGIALFGNDLSLTSHSSLETSANFLASCLFEGIGASAGDQHAADRE